MGGLKRRNGGRKVDGLERREGSGWPYEKEKGREVGGLKGRKEGGR